MAIGVRPTLLRFSPTALLILFYDILDQGNKRFICVDLISGYIKTSADAG